MGSCQCKQQQKEIECDEHRQPYKDIYESSQGSLNDYELIQPPLGEGAFGVVWKAKHKASGQFRAIKQINSKHSDEYQNIINEVNILKSLDHPNIIKIFDFFEINQKLYIITELCTGGELYDKLMEIHNFTEVDAAKIMKQILQALAYCHNQRIVHRDIKPENLLYESDKKNSQLKVIDFGTSKRTTGKNLREIIGTAYYMAPEMFTEQYNEKCDIWSAGVVLYILLSGKPPFDGDTDDDIFESIKKGTYSLSSTQWLGVSPEAKQLIRKMLEYQESKRYSAQDCLNDPWILQYTKEEVKAPVLESVLTNMKTFRTTQRIQEAAYMYIIKQFATKEEKEELLKTFQSLDKNSDGVLTKKELLEGYMRIMPESEAILQVDQIMQSVDKNQSGIIDYSEFVMATINRKTALTQERLEQAFKVIDKDNSGTITIEELKQMFQSGNKLPQETWETLMSEVDKNGDGLLSLKEFKDMMLRLI
ncbi:unnamed protein product [Paramecium primaurelia]|uniref:non-specific serine/threonine protein kinase n=1 Tax=Paramecium primaurelia TaxID=5886 RepID=A0A8S1JYQ8_PARPR|nr:unnamed protein product [Paramecium primaurelia]